MKPGAIQSFGAKLEHLDHCLVGSTAQQTVLVPEELGL